MGRMFNRGMADWRDNLPLHMEKEAQMTDLPEALRRRTLKCPDFAPERINGCVHRFTRDGVCHSGGMRMFDCSQTGYQGILHESAEAWAKRNGEVALELVSHNTCVCFTCNIEKRICREYKVTCMDSRLAAALIAIEGKGQGDAKPETDAIDDMLDGDWTGSNLMGG